MSLNELRRCAAWSAALTIPVFLFGIFLFNPRGTHAYGFTGLLGLAIIWPWTEIQSSGLQYELGLMALPLVVVAQWLWCFLFVWVVRLLVARLRTPKDRVQ